MSPGGAIDTKMQNVTLILAQFLLIIINYNDFLAKQTKPSKVISLASNTASSAFFESLNEPLFLSSYWNEWNMAISPSQMCCSFWKKNFEWKKRLLWPGFEPKLAALGVEGLRSNPLGYWDWADLLTIFKIRRRNLPKNHPRVVQGFSENKVSDIKCILSLFNSE